MKTKIEWTKYTWNPVTGCNKVSPGCKYCYAENFARRLKAMGLRKYQNGFKVTIHPEELSKISQLNRPTIIFVNSMSDLFHKDVPIDFIIDVFRVIQNYPQHIFQILTKRADVLIKFCDFLPWPKNLWMGVSVETQEYTWRIDYLKKTPAIIKFISFEPLLGPIETDLSGVDWVIVGGESGQKARPIDPSWVRQIRDQCLKLGISFFFKQWGGRNKKKNGRMLDGKIWDEFPVDIN